jgi:hypothetical protein
MRIAREEMRFASKKVSIKNVPTEAWTYKVGCRDMRQRILELEAIIDNLRQDDPNKFHAEVRNRQLENRLTEMRMTTRSFERSLTRSKISSKWSGWLDGAPLNVGCQSTRHTR